MATRWVGVVSAALVVVSGLVGAGCSSDDDKPPAESSTTVGVVSSTTSSASTTSAPVARPLAVITGDATLDGEPFDSRWVGAVVLKDGLVTPCQYSLPPVENGKYSVNVYADSASSGCGAPDSQVVLWTYAGDKIVFSSEAVPWPGGGQTATFAAQYSASDPEGAAPVTAQFNGAVFAKDRSPLPAGTKVEAFVGSTRCGIASVRASAEFTGYILAVVGPDSIPGCTRGAPLAFRIDGKPAAPTSAVNTPPGQKSALDLTVAQPVVP